MADDISKKELEGMLSQELGSPVKLKDEKPEKILIGELFYNTNDKGTYRVEEVSRQKIHFRGIMNADQDLHVLTKKEFRNTFVKQS